MKLKLIDKKVVCGRNEYKYEVYNDDKKIVGKLLLSEGKKNKKGIVALKIESIKIYPEFRNKNLKYGYKTVIELCKTFPNAEFYGEIWYELPINFWKKFDKDLQSLKTEERIQEFLNLYGLFEFKSSEVLKEIDL